MPVRAVIVADGEESATVIQPLLCPFQPTHKSALFDLFALQLGKDGEDADHGATERRGGIEGLRHRNEVNAVRQKDLFDEIQGVALGAGQAVELPDQGEIEGGNLGNQLLDAGTVEA